MACFGSPGRLRIMKSVEQFLECLEEDTVILGGNLPQCLSVHQAPFKTPFIMGLI
jgi:hypothetical protein